MSTIDTQVLAKPLEAADGLEQLIKKRQQRLNKLESLLGELQSGLYDAP